MDYTIKSIPTVYKGRNYRSRLEARWAAFFDLCEWDYEYEPVDLDGWFPDFRLRMKYEEDNDGDPFFVEVKPVTDFPQEVAGRMYRSAPTANLLILGDGPLYAERVWDRGIKEWIIGWCEPKKNRFLQRREPFWLSPSQTEEMIEIERQLVGDDEFPALGAIEKGHRSGKLTDSERDAGIRFTFRYQIKSNTRTIKDQHWVWKGHDEWLEEQENRSYNKGRDDIYYPEWSKARSICFEDGSCGFTPYHDHDFVEFDPNSLWIEAANIIQYRT